MIILFIVLAIIGGVACVAGVLAFGLYALSRGLGSGDVP